MAPLAPLPAMVGKEMSRKPGCSARQARSLSETSTWVRVRVRARARVLGDVDLGEGPPLVRHGAPQPGKAVRQCRPVAERHGRGGEHGRRRRRAAQPEVAQARVEQQLAAALTQGLHRRLRLFVWRTRHVARLQRRVHLGGQLGRIDEESRALGLHQHVGLQQRAARHVAAA
eukprot:scaffold50939_cov58-Phaeocystis_antarctica.AAC.4